MNNAANRPLDGRVAIVTGASRGIGAAVARAFAEVGASVVLAARTESALRALANDIADSGGHALAVPTDITDAEAVRQLVTQTLDSYGRLDAAVNNATGGRHGRPKDVAAALVWLCSDASSFVTGTVLAIDGGKMAGMAPFGGVPQTSSRAEG